jgi:uncharacterized protein (DUF1501 family)
MSATRREFIQLTSLLSLGCISIAHGQPLAPTGNAQSARLVVVMLRGAVDGLSLVAPFGDAEYYRSRSSIAIAKPGEVDGLIALNNLFGLHPSLAASLLPYWQKQQLAFIHASGSPDSTRSHFDAQDYIESATPGRKSTADGWLNRLAAQLSNGNTTRLQAVNLGPVMPRIFSGSATIASLASGASATAKGSLDQPNIANAFKQLYGGDDILSKTVREATETRREIMNDLASDDPKADQGSLPLSGLAADTARLGQLMARDSRVRLAFVPVGGWDTHANQGNGKGQLANRFSLLGQALDALVQNLGPQFNNTTILILSEFGRTAAQNGSGGTDHGHGNVSLVLGGGTKGGQVYGQWPGLERSALYEGRDLAVTTDFREIIASILEQQFRLPDRLLSAVLPSMPPRQPLMLF